MEGFLKTCGNLKRWRRVKDEAGKSKSFGFSDYEDVESVLRALRLFSGVRLCGKDLIIKVDENTQKYLDEYQKSKEEEENRLQAIAKEEKKATEPTESVDDEKQTEEEISKEEEKELPKDKDAVHKENLEEYLKKQKPLLDGVQKKMENDEKAKEEASVENSISKELSSIRERASENKVFIISTNYLTLLLTINIIFRMINEEVIDGKSQRPQEETANWSNFIEIE